jgi:hypothetical protein
MFVDRVIPTYEEINMSKYYSDEEIFEALEVAATASDGTNCDMIYLAIERIRQKDRQLSFFRERLDVAANIIGHNTISEVMYD